MRASKYREDSEYILLGHSLGGYLGSLFAIQYPQKITRLILLSPVGVPKKPESFDLQKIIEKQGSGTGRFVMRQAVSMWDNGWTPSLVMRGIGYFPAKKLATKFVESRMELETEEEREAMSELVVQTSMKPVSSMVCITIILMAGAWAHHPIRERLPEITVPICFMYGDRDWMGRASADNLLAAGRLREGSEVHTIINAGHQMMVINPLGTS